MTEETAQSGQTVFLVDDDFAVRHALRTLLERSSFLVRDFAAAEELLEDIDPAARGVLVLDQRMDGMSGLELQTELRGRDVTLPIIFITGHGDVPMSVKAMKEGAFDFLEKPFSNEQLLESIRGALLREARDHREHAHKAAIRARYEGLTPREQEVMRYIVQGMSNKRLAKQLGVSNRTIEVHRSRVMMKMGSESLPELVRMAALCGIGER